MYLRGARRRFGLDRRRAAARRSRPVAAAPPRRVRETRVPRGGTVLLQLVRVEVRRHLLDEVVAVADVDERPRVRQLRVHEERLHGLGLVDRRVAADALDLLELLALRGGFDVLEVHQRVLREVDDLAEVVEEALVALEVLEEIHQRLRADLLVVLGRDLRHDLHVASHVAG